MSWPTWNQTITWDWCPDCSTSWHWGDKPQCSCQRNIGGIDIVITEWPTWDQTITWEWCPECSISWQPGDKPLCTCERKEAIE